MICAFNPIPNAHQMRKRSARLLIGAYREKGKCAKRAFTYFPKARQLRKCALAARKTGTCLASISSPPGLDHHAMSGSMLPCYDVAMSETEVTGDKQRPAYQFQPGRSGNPAGRPRGARNKLSENFLADLASCWEERGAEALRRCAEEQPEVLIKVIASLMPREATLDVNIDILHEVGDALQAFRQLSAAIGAEPQIGPRRLRKLFPVIDAEPE
jgi:Family of unknown function (DUF5681)